MRSAMVVAGVVLLGVGAFGAGRGISDAVGLAGAIRDDAVARGVVSDAPGASIPFESRHRHFTIYLDFKDITSNAARYDDATGGTVCTIAEGTRQQTVRGSRQGTAATLGSLASVGGFDLSGSSARIACRYDRFNGRFRRPSAVPYIVTPHKTSEVAVAVIVIIAGVAVFVGGILLIVFGRRARRR